MPSLNRVQLIGQVTDPVHVHMEGDLKEVVATIMTTEPGRNAATGERWVAVDYHPVEFQGRLAELVAAKAGIGALLFIEASLATESVAGAEGSGLKVTKIKARSVQILQEGAPEAPANTAVAAEPAKAPVVAPVVAPIAATVAAPIATPAAPAAPAVNTAPVAAATQAPRRHFVPGARRAVPAASPAASPTAAPVAAPAVAQAAHAPTVAPAATSAQAPAAAVATPTRKWSRGLNRAAAAATA